MIKTTTAFLTDVFEKHDVIIELAKRDCQRQFLGSYLGLAWTFIQPLIFIGIIYTVFTLGLRTRLTDSELPFGLYLVCGMVCWLFISKSFSDTTSVISAHSFLVKRVDFRLSVLPIVKILSSLFPHSILLVVAICLAWYHGYPPSIYSLQLLYYIFAASFLLLGLGWITSSTSIFVKDISSIVSIFVQFGFWITPIFWNISLVPEKYRWLVKLNPAFYLVEGYRDSLIGKTWFWEKADETFYYWFVSLVVFYLGVKIFRALRPQFAEVI